MQIVWTWNFNELCKLSEMCVVIVFGKKTLKTYKLRIQCHGHGLVDSNRRLHLKGSPVIMCPKRDWNWCIIERDDLIYYPDLLSPAGFIFRATRSRSSNWTALHLTSRRYTLQYTNVFFNSRQGCLCESNLFERGPWYCIKGTNQ